MLSASFARKVFGNDNPIGRTLKYNQKYTLTVVGVMEDFGPEDVWEPVDILISSDFLKDEYQWMANFSGVQTVVKLANGAAADILEAKLLDKYCGYWKSWSRNGDDNNMLWGSSLTRWDELYFSPLVKTGFRYGNTTLVQILLLVAVVLLVSAVFNSEQQSKRVALSKVMCSSTQRLVMELSRHFMLLSVLAGVIAVPIAIKAMQHYLEGFYYRIDFPWGVLVVAVLTALGISFLSIVGQTLKVARRNPIESIKTE